MDQEETVLCGASAYTRKFYLNEDFTGLPLGIREELKIMCVLFTEEIGGILTLVFSKDGTLNFRTKCEESDLFYDTVGSALKIKQLRQTKEELLRSLELYYQVLFLGEAFPEEEA